MDRRTFLRMTGLGLLTVNPPGVKRGWNSQKLPSGPPQEHQQAQLDQACVGVHWLRGRVPHDRVEALRDYCCIFFGDDFEERDYGLWRYDRMFELPRSVSINYQSTKRRAEAITGGYAVLEVPGSALESLDPDLIGSFIKGLSGYEFECSRIDVYFDDFDAERLSPRELYRRVYEVDLFGDEFRREFTGFLDCSLTQKAGKRRRGKLSGRGLTYDEVSFGRRGSRGSGKYLRYYDKRLESGGEQACGRFELELCKERADKIYKAFLNVRVSGWAHLIGLAIGGAIDFRDRPVDGNGQLLRAGDKNWSRCKRKYFWTKILARLGGRLKMSKPTKPMTVERSAAWIKEQCSGVLQMCARAYGINELLTDLLDIIGSSDRMSKKHREALAAYLSRDKRNPVPTIEAVRSWADAEGVQLESEPGELEPEEEAPSKPPATRQFTMGVGRQHLWDKGPPRPPRDI